MSNIIRHQTSQWRTAEHGLTRDRKGQPKIPRQEEEEEEGKDMPLASIDSLQSCSNCNNKLDLDVPTKAQPLPSQSDVIITTGVHVVMYSSSTPQFSCPLVHSDQIPSQIKPLCISHTKMKKIIFLLFHAEKRDTWMNVLQDLLLVSLW